MTKKIGILGSGNVGKALSVGFLKHGYQVEVGTEHPEKVKEWGLGDTIKVSSFADVADANELIVLAVKGVAAEDVVRKLSVALAGKIVIDTTNPIAEVPPENGVLKFFTNLGESLMERLERIVPEAHFVKAFNSIGNAYMVDPDFGGVKPTMFICGNNDDAKKMVTDILEEFGWEVSDMGSSASARAIEPLCILWCIPGLRGGSWAHAFKMLKKPAS